jgi:hypothetical protein
MQMADIKEEMAAWMKEHVGINTPQIKPGDLPEKFIIPNPHNIQVKDQGNTPSCTSHAFATMWEYQLCNHFNESVVIDAQDLWDKQLAHGTATSQGDTFVGVAFIADKYGMKFETKSGIQGIFRPSKGIEITHIPSQQANKA